ncbi:hypothetical protein RUM43_009600 [Polyplax serrata]|uniref:Uncharacterized protein n=1 Tax=Polyplax serrata TaxID=468196 RepID=A0AAN8S8K9_POLSC
MADENELKSMILSFRMSELHMLLGFAGRNKSGRKSELQNRAIELLKLGSYPVILKIRNLYKSIQESFQNGTDFNSVSLCDEPAIDIGNKGASETGNMQQPHGRGYVPPSYIGNQSQINMRTYEQMYASGVYHHQYQTQGKQGNMIHPPHYPVHPDVKLKRLPFYEVSAELVKPSSLVPQGSQRQQDNTFVFHLTPQQATAIGMSRDMRPGSKVEYSVQVQLRFCLLETTSEQEDCFPPGVIVKINNKLCQLPNPIPTNKPGVEPKRPPRPVNITPLVKISPTAGNSIHVQWSTDYTRGYVVAVYLVQKKTSEDLLNRLKAKGVRGADYTRGMIKDKLNEDADSEIATTSLRVSLVCPLGKMRMITPCRASTCQHLQCFDASLYLQMNERKPTWMCPVCDKPAIYDKLVIDGYFQEVLSSGKLSHDGNEIQLHSDGSWSSLVIKKEQSRVVDQAESPMKMGSKVETLDIEPEVIPQKTVGLIQTPVPSTQSSDASSAKPGPSKKEEVIDLTLSDSDDEPLIPRKKQIPDSSHQVIKSTESHSHISSNRSTSVSSSSGQRSPSLIIIDSDSPPPSAASVSLEVPKRPPPPYSAAVSYLASQSHFLDLDADTTFPHRY